MVAATHRLILNLDSFAAAKIVYNSLLSYEELEFVFLEGCKVTCGLTGSVPEWFDFLKKLEGV